MSQNDRTLGLVGNAAFKVPCRAATTANITLSGEQTVGGVACVTGDRVLVKNQTDSIDNGIWVVDTGSWERAKDFNGSYDAVQGTIVPVYSGSGTYSTYVLVTDDVTIGTDAMTFEFSTSEALAAMLAASSGSTLIGWIRNAVGAVATTLATWLGWQPFNVKEFGAVGNGTTDDSASIQAAIDAAEVAGGKVYFPLGQYSLDSTGVTILGSGVVLEGQVPRFVGGSHFGVQLLYSGTGIAVTFGQSGTTYYRNGLNNAEVRATGGATSSATAVGVKLINQHYVQSHRAGIKDFEAGVGLLFQPAGASQFGATSTFYDILIHLCKVAVRSVGADAVTKDNHTIFVGGAVLQDSQPAGSIGFDLQQYSDSYRFYGTDAEGFEIGWKIDGSNHSGIGARSEACTTHVSYTTNATNCSFVEHSPQGSGTPVTDTSTARSSTFLGRGGVDANILRGKIRVRPFADATEVFEVAKSDGTTLFDISSSGTPNAAYPNGVNLIGYSDAFVTQKWSITGATGLLRVSDGTTGAPSISLLSDTDTGIALDNAQFTFIHSGLRVAAIGTTTNGLVIRNDSPLSWGSSATVTPDTFIYRDAANIIALKNANLAQEYRVYAGNGGFLSNVKSVTELLTIAAAATTVSATTIPAGAILIGVSVRVTTVIPTATTFTYATTTGGTALNTAAVSTAAGSTDPGTAAGASYRAAATTVTITPNLTPAAATGVVRLQYYYLQVTPATS